ncbi:desulfoferrodoxin [Candidatus Riflebacteria bacterium]
MTELMQIYKCNKCGNIVEITHAAGGTLHCCNQAMVHLEEKTADKTTEKHVPVIEEVEGGYKVKVGSVPHPMEEKHFIEWIELIVDDTKVYRQYLKPGSPAEAVFLVKGSSFWAREYCNLHSLWKGDL